MSIKTIPIFFEGVRLSFAASEKLHKIIAIMGNAGMDIDLKLQSVKCSFGRHVWVGWVSGWRASHKLVGG